MAPDGELHQIQLYTFQLILTGGLEGQKTNGIKRLVKWMMLSKIKAILVNAKLCEVNETVLKIVQLW